MKTITVTGATSEYLEGNYNLKSLDAMRFEMKSKLATACRCFDLTREDRYRVEALHYQDACNIIGVPLYEITDITIEKNYKGLRNCNRLSSVVLFD